ncbi:MAG TPA: hypothetical protein VF389_11830 [Woeseiaceae bacterium]
MTYQTRPSACIGCHGAGEIEYHERNGLATRRCDECGGSGSGPGEDYLCCRVCGTALFGSQCLNLDCSIGAALGPDDVRWIAEDDAQFEEAEQVALAAE